MTCCYCFWALREYRQPPAEPIGYKGASVSWPLGAVHMGTPGCSGSRVLWQGTKENTQTTDGHCCLPPRHEPSVTSGLQKPTERQTRRVTWDSVRRTCTSYVRLQIVNKQHKAMLSFQRLMF